MAYGATTFLVLEQMGVFHEGDMIITCMYHHHYPRWQLRSDGTERMSNMHDTSSTA